MVRVRLSQLIWRNDHVIYLKAHFMANGLPLDHHQFVVMDVFEDFELCKEKGIEV